MTKSSARERLAVAAFALFDERGYEQTTVEDITERAGLGRTTFFRYYRSKDDVISPTTTACLSRSRNGCGPRATAPRWPQSLTRYAWSCCTTSARAT
jgi:hypothetical protein